MPDQPDDRGRIDRLDDVYLEAALRFAFLDHDADAGCSNTVDWYHHNAGLVPAPALDAVYDWPRELWWPASPAGRLARALHDHDDRALTYL